VGSELMVAVATGKRRRRYGKGYRAIRCWASCATGKLSLWVNGCLELRKLAIQEVLHACAELRCAERFHRFLICTESAVIANIGVVTPKAKRMASMCGAQILINLNEVLRTAERDRIARRKGRVPRHAN